MTQVSLKKLKPKSKKATVVLDYSEQRFAPVPEFQSLISNLRLDPQTGVFKSYGMLNIYFLPESDVGGKKADYNSNANDPDQMLIWADIVALASGETVATFHYAADMINRIETPIYVKSGYGSKNRFVTEAILKEPGAYEMRFHLAGDHFYTHAFDVIKTESDDPYSPVEAMYALGGDWENQALLQVNKDDEKGEFELRFQPIIAYRGFHVRSGRNQLQLDGEAERKVLLKREGSVIGTFHFKENKDDDPFGDKYVPAFDGFSVRVGGSELTSGLYPFQQVPKNEKVGERMVKMKNLSDGNYEIEMTIMDISDRPDFTKTYFFSVKGGRVMPSPRADRKNHKDKLTLIESGRDYVVINSK